MKLSTIIITKNEEENIKRCLESIKDISDEIIVVDSGSTDNTLKIAKKYNAKIYKRKFDTFDKQKNFASSKAKGDWIFSLDADEEASKNLQMEIISRIKDTKYDGFLIPRRNIILGKEIRHTRWSPDIHIWLWRRGKGKWTKGVHSEVKVDTVVGRFEHAKIHYQYETVTEFLDMVNSYTRQEAEERKEKGVSFSYFRLFFDPALSFFRRFIYKRGFLDGWRGFVLSYLMAVYHMSIWVKIWERSKN